MLPFAVSAWFSYLTEYRSLFLPTVVFFIFVQRFFFPGADVQNNSSVTHSLREKNVDDQSNVTDQNVDYIGEQDSVWNKDKV